MPDDNGPTSAHREFTLLAVTLDYFDAINKVHIDRLMEDPQVHYYFLYRHEYPEDHWKWTKEEYIGHLVQSQEYIVHLTVQSSESNNKIAGLAM